MKQSKASMRQANVLLVLLMLAYMVSFIDRQILSLMVGPIRTDLDITDFQFSLLQGAAFAIFYTTLGIPLGWLADRSRRTTLIGIGAIVWSLATAACGLVRSFGGLFGARVAVGAGEAALSPSAYSLLADSFPPQRLARAMGIYGLGIPIGAGLGFMIGGSLIATVSSATPTSWPIIGVVQPWQNVFLLVGLPGAVLGLVFMLLKEPARLRSAEEDSVGSEPPSFGSAMKYLWRHRAKYAPIFLGIMFLSVAGYGMLNWYPTFLIRRHGMSVDEVGMLIGVLYLVCGTAGTIGAPLLSEYLAKRGYADANLRTVTWVGATLAPCAAIGPLVGELWLTVLLAMPTVVLLNAGFGVTTAALQIATPNRMRGMMSALLLLSNNLAGLALGSSSIPFLTDFLFRDDRMVGYSVAIVLGVAAVLAAWSASGGLMNRQQLAAAAQ